MGAFALLGVLQACGGRSQKDGATHATAGAGSSGADATSGAAGTLDTSADAGSAGSDAAPDPEGTVILDEQVDWLNVNDERIYWLADPDLFKSCLKASCASSIVSYPSAIQFPTLSPKHVYWSGGTELLTCPPAGCGSTPGVVETFGAVNAPVYFAADGDYVYWASSGVQRCLFSGCNGGPETVVVDELPGYSSYVVVHGEYVFWIGNGIRRALKDGAPAATSIAPSAVPRDFVFAVNDSAVYWAEDNAILSCPFNGCAGAPATVFAGSVHNGSLAVDATGLYWKDETGDGIHYCALPGCANPRVLTSAKVRFFALDDQFLYWNDGSGGELGQAIHRLAKPAP